MEKHKFFKKYYDYDHTLYNLMLLLMYMIAVSLIVFGANAFPITTDETTETSIIWNLSQRPNDVNITSIAFDGIALEGYIPNPNQLVQNNLYAGETHLIIVTDTSGNTSSAEAKTLASPNRGVMSTHWDLWFLIAIAVLFIIAAVYTTIPLLGYVSLLVSFLGILGSINNDFITGAIFIIMFIVSALVAYDW